VRRLTRWHGHVSLAGLSTRAIVVTLAALLCALGPTRGARADEPDAPTVEPGRSAAEVDDFLARYAAAPVDGPELRLPVSPTRLWLDVGYARTDDLSSLPYITGKAQNVRSALGAAWRWGRFAFTGEMPFLHVTTIDVATIMNQPPEPVDAHQTAASIGDLRLGADWTDHLGDAIVAGFGFRARVPTHTTGFSFHLIDGSLATYRLPYYFHLEPTAILGAAFGRFAFVVNEGVIVLLGPNGTFEGFYIHVPTIAFWDAAYAVSWAPLAAFAASLELATDIQLNHVSGQDFTTFNDLRSVSLAPALQWHVAEYRVDLVARFGLTNGANLFGIMEFAGTTSYTLRVSRLF
jgi:hypothetical protein